MKRMMRSRLTLCAVVGALAVALVLVIGAGFALAFPMPGTIVQINSIGVLSGAEVEKINVTGSFLDRRVYVGPYEK